MPASSSASGRLIPSSYIASWPSSHLAGCSFSHSSVGLFSFPLTSKHWVPTAWSWGLFYFLSMLTPLETSCSLGFKCHLSTDDPPILTCSLYSFLSSPLGTWPSACSEFLFICISTQHVQNLDFSILLSPNSLAYPVRGNSILPLLRPKTLKSP